MSAKGKNPKKIPRLKVYPPALDPNEPILAMIDAAKAVDEELDPYPQPDRCKNCGNWILAMFAKGTGTCGHDCEKAVEERKAKRRERDRARKAK